MQADDKIKLSWTRVDVTKYTATVTVIEYAELIGMPVAALLEYDSADRAASNGKLNLADELASVEDAGDADEGDAECEREDIYAVIKRKR